MDVPNLGQASKERPGMKLPILGTFFDVAARLFRRKSSVKSFQVDSDEMNDRTIKVQMSENRTLSMAHTELARNEESIVLKGTITKKAGCSIPPGAHLHVVVTNAKGKPLLNDVVRCDLSLLRRKDLKGTGCMAQFPIPRESIDSVKIVYHDHNHSQCTHWGCKRSNPLSIPAKPQ